MNIRFDMKFRKKILATLPRDVDYADSCAVLFTSPVRANELLLTRWEFLRTKSQFLNQFTFKIRCTFVFHLCFLGFSLSSFLSRYKLGFVFYI